MTVSEIKSLETAYYNACVSFYSIPLKKRLKKNSVVDSICKELKRIESTLKSIPDYRSEYLETIDFYAMNRVKAL